MIPSIVLKSVLWRCSESAWTFWKFQLLRFSLRPIVDPKQPLLSVRNVCPFLGKDIHPITIPSLVMKSALWRGPESARAFCNFQKSVNSLHPNVYMYIIDKPARHPISISLVLVSDCQTSATTLWEREQKKYWPQKVSFGSPDVLKTIVSPHVPLYPTLMSFVSLQVHHKVSKTSSKMKGLSLTASKWGKDLFWSAFIFHSQGKLAFEAENQLPQNGGSISFKVKSYYFLMWYQHL